MLPLSLGKLRGFITPAFHLAGQPGRLFQRTSTAWRYQKMPVVQGGGVGGDVIFTVCLFMGKSSAVYCKCTTRSRYLANYLFSCDLEVSNKTPQGPAGLPNQIQPAALLQGAPTPTTPCPALILAGNPSGSLEPHSFTCERFSGLYEQKLACVFR